MMEESLNLQRNGVLENVDLSQLQGEINKLSPGVLRGIDGGTLHFITIPRTSDQEFIDHTLLSPEYIAAHIQNGLVVDIIQTQPSDHHDTIESQNIYSDNPSIQHHQQHHQSTDRHYIHHHDSETISNNSIALSQTQLDTSNSLNRENVINNTNNENATATTSVIMGDSDRRMTTAFLHYVQKQTPQLLTNEAPVIVSNKEMATLTPLNEIDMSNNFMQHTMANNHSNLPNNSLLKTTTQMPAKNQSINSLPPLPPLTPISKLQTIRRIHDLPSHQHIIQYKNASSSSSNDYQLLKSDIGTDTTISATNVDDDGLTLINGNGKIVRQITHEINLPVAAPKKSLPHKKRIAKKLKNIHPTIDDQMHLQIQTQPEYHQSHTQSDQYQMVQHQPQQAQSQIIQQVKQPTTIPNDHLMAQTQAQSHFENQTIVSNMSSIPISSPVLTQQSILSRHSCELCGIQCAGQLEFFNHLKMHYEPLTHLKMENRKLMESQPSNGIDLSQLDLPVISSAVTSTSSSIVQQNLQNIYDVPVAQKSNDPCISNVPLSSVVNMTSHFTHLPINSDQLNQVNDPGLIDDNDDDDVCDNDDSSMQNYGDSSVNDNIKLEQNEFSDTEDMLEGGVVDKVQSTVDNYIENDSDDVKDMIGMEQNNQMGNVAEVTCTTKNWYQQNSNCLTNNIVYQITKPNDVDEPLDASNFQLHPHPNQNDSTLNSTVIERIPATSTSEELTLIYEINVNDKDLSDHYALIDDNTPESILRRQLLKAESDLDESHMHNHTVLANTNSFDCDEIDLSTARENHFLSSDKNKLMTFPMRNIQDEFIEEEKTDSESDLKPNGTRKKKKIFRCKRCDKLCNSKNALHYHFLSHTGERPHQCEICGKSFFASSALKVHKRLHSGDKPYECSFCNRPFRQWGDLKYHIQSRHTTEKNHQCEFCGKDFARRYSLVIHRRIHTGEKNYKCEFCDKQFRASSYLQVHRKIHTGEKPYVCEECGKKFRVRGDLKRHSNIHERYKAKEIKIDEIGDSTNSSITKTEAYDGLNTYQLQTDDAFNQTPSTASIMNNCDGKVGNRKTKKRHSTNNSKSNKSKTKRETKLRLTNHSKTDVIANYSDNSNFVVERSIIIENLSNESITMTNSTI